MNRDGRVFVGVSGSIGNLAAVHTAAQAAARTGRRLVALNAWQSPGGEMAARRAPCPPLDDACRDHAQAILDDALASVPAGVEVERRVIRGPAERLLVASADHAADLLVVGAGRTGGLTRLFHGATTRYCVAHAHCPVLAVPPSELIRDLTDLEGHKPATLATSMVREGLRGV